MRRRSESLCQRLRELGCMQGGAFAGARVMRMVDEIMTTGAPTTRYLVVVGPGKRMGMLQVDADCSESANGLRLLERFGGDARWLEVHPGDTSEITVERAARRLKNACQRRDGRVLFRDGVPIAQLEEAVSTGGVGALVSVNVSMSEPRLAQDLSVLASLPVVAMWHVIEQHAGADLLATTVNGEPLHVAVRRARRAIVQDEALDAAA